MLFHLGLSVSWLKLQQRPDIPQSCCILLQPGVPYWEVIQVVSLVCLLPALEQILQQNDAFPDVRWVTRPHKAPSIFKLGPRAYLTWRKYIYNTWKRTSQNINFCNINKLKCCQVPSPLAALCDTFAQTSWGLQSWPSPPTQSPFQIRLPCLQTSHIFHYSTAKFFLINPRINFLYERILGSDNLTTLGTNRGPNFGWKRDLGWKNPKTLTTGVYILESWKLLQRRFSYSGRPNCVVILPKTGEK